MGEDEIVDLGECQHNTPVGILQGWGWDWARVVRLPMRHGEIRDSEGPGRNRSYD